MILNKLTKIANKYKTDKGTLYSFKHGYTEFYEPFVKKYECPIILEVGVDKGGSLMMWNDYYEGKCRIYGIDIDDKKEYETENIHIYQCDQGNKNSLDAFVKEMEDNNIKFDIIIDDGSHTVTHQFLTLYKFSSLLNKDGIYIIEDLHTSFNFNYSGDNWHNILNYLASGGVMPSLYPYITTEQMSELSGKIKDVQIYNRYNPNNDVCLNRSITSVISLK